MRGGSKGKHAERSETTRGALLKAARELFAKNGYAATTTEEVVRAAGVTRGALYHHFAGKEALFSAVYEQMEAELAERSLRAAIKGKDPMDRLRRGLDAFLDACLEPEVQRIVLIDALTVLGWDAWQEIGVRYNFALMMRGIEEVLGEARGAGEAESVAHLIQGALMRAGLVVARAEKPRQARQKMGMELGLILDGLPRRRE